MSGMREEIAGDFEEIYRAALVQLRKAADAETSYSALCSCGRRVQIMGIPDLRALTESLRFLADQGFGKAPTAATVVPVADGVAPDELSREQRVALLAEVNALLEVE